MTITDTTGPSKRLFTGLLNNNPAFTAHLAAQGRELTGYVQREFEDYLKCGRLNTTSCGYVASLAKPAAG